MDTTTRHRLYYSREVKLDIFRNLTIRCRGYFPADMRWSVVLSDHHRGDRCLLVCGNREQARAALSAFID